MLVGFLMPGLVSARADGPAERSSGVVASSPTRVLLAFDTPTPPDETHICENGPRFKQASAGDLEQVTVCTFDENGDPAATDAGPEHLQFTVTPASDPEPGAIRIHETPPSETSGAEAEGHLVLDAVHEGDEYLNVFLLDGNGVVLDKAWIELRVTRTCFCGPVAREISISLGYERARGKVEAVPFDEPDCESDQMVNIYRRLRGPDGFIGSVQTNSPGTYSFFTGHVKGRYYSTVTPSSEIDSEDGDQMYCEAAGSPVVRRA
jgi:hypothetical protein